MRTRLLTVTVMALLALSLAGVLPGVGIAHAWDAYYRYVSVGDVTCSTANGGSLTTSTQVVEWNGSSVSTATFETVTNGVGGGEGATFPIPLGTGSQAFGGYGTIGRGAYPFTHELIYRSYWDGTLVYTSRVTMVCEADGAAASVTITNTDEYSDGGGGVGSADPSRPGRDMVAMPAWAVVGSFVTDTPLYYAPQEGAATDLIIEAGKTLWVTGRSPGGDFYQVVLSGRHLWVPVESIGANFDAVWQGMPLPTQTIG
jgi:hypothetical protein